MLYTKLTFQAIMIAYRHHHGAKDRAILKYIFHSFHLAEQMDNDGYAICVAFLHDVVNDMGI